MNILQKAWSSKTKRLAMVLASISIGFVAFTISPLEFGFEWLIALPSLLMNIPLMPFYAIPFALMASFYWPVIVVGEIIIGVTSYFVLKKYGIRLKGLFTWWIVSLFAELARLLFIQN